MFDFLRKQKIPWNPDKHVILELKAILRYFNVPLKGKTLKGELVDLCKDWY